jgi:hypothetical protein
MSNIADIFIAGLWKSVVIGKYGKYAEKFRMVER